MKETETKRFGLNQSEINDEFVNEILEDNGIEINLTKKRKKLLAILLYINGIDKKNENGYFFVENSFLCEIVGIAENNLINGLNYLKKIKLIPLLFLQFHLDRYNQKIHRHCFPYP